MLPLTSFQYKPQAHKKYKDDERLKLRNLKLILMFSVKAMCFHINENLPPQIRLCCLLRAFFVGFKNCPF